MIVAAPDLPEDAAAEIGHTGFGDFQRLVEDALLQSREPCLDEADLLVAEWAHRNQLIGFAGDGENRIQDRTPDGKGNDFDGCDHLAGRDNVEGFECRHRDRFVDQVQAVELFPVHGQHAVFFGNQVAAAGEGFAGPQVSSRRQCPADGGRRLVLGNVVGIEPGDDDRFNSGLLQERDIFLAQQLAFLELAPGQLCRMSEEGARRLANRDGPEFH